MPGARWFRADLHVHTLDDHPSGRIRWGGQAGPPLTEPILQEYARTVLKTAAARGVEVIGLTPHAVYCDGQPNLSAVWRIIEAWNSDDDDDGVPFREKVYAVFPGFEAAMEDGTRGVHLLFLFDPEISHEGLVRAFHAVMDGVDPWTSGNLNNAGKRADEAFDSLVDMCSRDEAGWSWLCLAPHSTSRERGLFGELKSQVLQYFPHAQLAGMELGDSELPEDAHAGREWLKPAMEKYHHAFFHASDAYVLNPDPTSTTLSELGCRTTVLKMADPRIEALRQAFLAADSRLRLAFQKDGAGRRLEPSSVPEPLALDRPWLRSATVRGGTSFFGGSEGGERSTTFHFSPDFTCVIGGRMTGKSTLLDGLRVAFGFPLPNDPQVGADVEGRARARFLSGSPAVETDILGPVDPTSDVRDRWPAMFFTQRELQQAVADQHALRGLLYQLLPGRGGELLAQYSAIEQHSRDLSRLIPRLTAATEALGVAEQDLAASAGSKVALERFETVGAARLSVVQADLGRIRASKTAAGQAAGAIVEASASATTVEEPRIDSDRLQHLLDEPTVASMRKHIAEMRQGLVASSAALELLRELLETLEIRAGGDVESFRTELERALAQAGGTAEELNQFTALSATAELYEERRIAKEAASTQLADLRKEFNALLVARDQVRAGHREMMSEVAEAISARFKEQVRVAITQDAVDGELDAWVTSLRERGVTRWWHEARRPISPAAILAALDERVLDQLGMSEQVTSTFAEVMTEARRWELQSVNTPDRYVLEFRVAADEYRPMDQLSGGRQVSLLLSLLLESDDNRPLVIDQPEYELDKAYLFDTLLPALRRLKGLRQVIFVTHDANIVVNGDADQVVYLDADADRGWVVAEGAIEQPSIRKAVLTVVDGGPAAFELRSRKYGF